MFDILLPNLLFLKSHSNYLVILFILSGFVFKCRTYRLSRANFRNIFRLCQTVCLAFNLPVKLASLYSVFQKFCDLLDRLTVWQTPAHYLHLYLNVAICCLANFCTLLTPLLECCHLMSGNFCALLTTVLDCCNCCLANFCTLLTPQLDCYHLLSGKL